jgi:hypothetical protein
LLLITSCVPSVECPVGKRGGKGPLGKSV